MVSLVETQGMINLKAVCRSLMENKGERRVSTPSHCTKSKWNFSDMGAAIFCWSSQSAQQRLGSGAIASTGCPIASRVQPSMTFHSIFFILNNKAAEQPSTGTPGFLTSIWELWSTFTSRVVFLHPEKFLLGDSTLQRFKSFGMEDALVDVRHVHQCSLNLRLVVVQDGRAADGPKMRCRPW